MSTFNILNLLWLIPVPVFYKLTDVYRFKYESAIRYGRYSKVEPYSILWHFFSSCMNIANITVILILTGFDKWSWIPAIITVARLTYDLMWNILNRIIITYPGDGRGALVERIEAVIAHLFNTRLIVIHWIGKLLMIILSILSLCFL